MKAWRRLGGQNTGARLEYSEVSPEFYQLCNILLLRRLVDGGLAKDVFGDLFPSVASASVDFSPKQFLCIFGPVSG